MSISINKTDGAQAVANVESGRSLLSYANFVRFRYKTFDVYFVFVGLGTVTIKLFFDLAETLFEFGSSVCNELAKLFQGIHAGDPATVQQPADKSDASR